MGLKAAPVAADAAGMGDVQLVRELRDQRELVFAYLADGTVVWGLDRATGNQWWYAPEHAGDVRPQLESALAALEALPLHDSTPHTANASPPAANPAVEPSPVRTGDLAQHQPGHAVLAEIERKHAKATSSTVAGMPGVLDEDIGQWCVGYVGEATVGAALAGLGPGWLLLHGVPVGDRGSDIDHVVIGPPGVFTINTKHHPGGKIDVKGSAVFVGRTHLHYIRNAELDATRAEAAVSPTGIAAPVRAVVCVVGARLSVKQEPDTVHVLAVEDLVRWLQNQPPALSEQQVGQLYDQLRWASSWTSQPPPAPAAPWVAQFAYQLSQEHVLVSQHRRRPRPTGRAEARLSQRKRSLTGRRRSSRRRRDLLSLLVALVALLCFAAWGPQLIRTFTDSATKSPQRSVPSPSSSSPPVAGSQCQVKGAKATDAAGRALVCRMSSSTQTLTWRNAK
jgi:hypothetical protein